MFKLFKRRKKRQAKKRPVVHQLYDVGTQLTFKPQEKKK